MNTERVNLIKTKLYESNVEYGDVNGILQIIVSPLEVIEVCTILKEDDELYYDMLIDELGIDRFQKENRFEVICNLYSTKFKDRLFVKVKLDSKNPEMHTLTKVWKSANWYERECYDMFGIKFTNHPDLRRIYMPEDYELHPLRKDIPLMGIPNTLKLPEK